MKYLPQTLILAAAVAGTLAVYTHSGNAQSSSSTPVTAPSQVETVPNSPSLLAQNNRSLPSGTVLVPPSSSGGGNFKVINGTSQDAFIKLVNLNSPTLAACRGNSL